MSVSSVAFSHTGQSVASASADKTIRLWDTKTGKEVQKLEGHDEPVRTVTFSHDDQLVASASNDKTVRLWGAKTGVEIASFFNGSNVPNSPKLSFTKDGEYLTTSTGRFDLELHIPSTYTEGRQILTEILLDNQWIRRQNEDLLWLSHEYRASTSALCEEVLAVGTASEAISFSSFYAGTIEHCEAYYKEIFPQTTIFL
ncbi:hypothetical protein D6C80_08407 [Aureobasidium pullulans]|nr:hypothetical protein D6C80_08407 [Aureobasidium pullulans]